MRPHFILSTFKAAGGYVSPPGLWTPPSDKAAERLIAAKCIRPATDGEIGRLGAEVTVDSPVIVEIPTVEQVLAAGYTEEAAVAIIKRQESLASYIASGMTPDEAMAAVTEAGAKAEAEKAQAEAKAEADKAEAEKVAKAEAEATEESAQAAGAPGETEASEPETATEPEATEPAPKPEPKPKGKRSKKGRR